MPHVGPWEIALIVVLILVIFGPKRLPEMARSFGQAIQEFKKTGKKVQEEVQSSIEDEPQANTTDSSGTSTQRKTP